MMKISPNDDIQSSIDELAEIAKSKNKNETLVLSDGVYYLDEPIVVVGGVSIVSEGKGRRSVRLIFNNAQSDTALVTVKKCNGIVFDGIIF